MGTRMSTWRRITKFNAVGGAGVLTYQLVVRPWMRRWGATDEEVTAALPGDELVRRLDAQSTHAVTIAAPPEAVWPWIVQMGQDRGGLYSYLWVENALLRLGFRNADRIVPEWQDLKVGDRIWFVPEHYATSRFGPVVMAIDPPRSLILSMGVPDQPCPGTWQFILRQRSDGDTRLLLRSRASAEAPLAMRVMNAVMEAGYFVMERRMLLGIKERAERTAIAESSGVVADHERSNIAPWPLGDTTSFPHVESTLTDAAAR